VTTSPFSSHGKRLALLIGSGVFRDPRLPPLPAVERDIAALGDVLADPNRGAYARKLLLNCDAARLRGELEDALLGAARYDEVLIFVSGHGFLDQDGKLFFATRDTDLDRLLSSAVESRLLSTLMKRSPAAAVVVLLDCCHSGAFGLKGVVELSSAAFTTGRGRVVLTATTATELAWEGKRVSIGSGMSVFTHHVVTGIRSGAADVDGDGYITVRDLFDYVRIAMKGARDLQIPTLIADAVESFPIISFATKANAAEQELSSIIDPPSPVSALSRFGTARFTLRRPFTMELLPFPAIGPLRAGHVSRAPVSNMQLALFLRETREQAAVWPVSAVPATNVSWFLAVEFCEWLSEQTGVTFALPTESEFALVVRSLAHSRFALQSEAKFWEWCSNSRGDMHTSRKEGGEAAQIMLGIRKSVCSIDGAQAELVVSAGLFPGFWYENVGFRVIAR
jgi:hypothetical protein